MYNSERSADLVLRLTSPVQGTIKAGLISYFSNPTLYSHMSGDRCRMAAKWYTRMHLYWSLSLSVLRPICTQTLMILSGQGTVGLSLGVGTMFAWVSEADRGEGQERQVPRSIIVVLTFKFHNPPFKCFLASCRWSGGPLGCCRVLTGCGRLPNVGC